MPVTTLRPDAPFFIVLNSGSGRTDTDLRCATIKDVLAAAGRRCEIDVVHDAARLPEAAAAMAARAQAEAGVLVAAGGDGTLNVVAHEAVRRGCAYGVLPQGTFNYFARTHRIPEDLADAVRALLAARVTPVQIGTVNGHIFLVNASLGLYPQLLEQREHDKRRFGRSRVVALLSAIKAALGGHRSLRIELELDGVRKRLRTPTLFVGNNRLQMEQVGLRPMEHALDEGRLPTGRGAFGTLGDTDDVVHFDFKRLTVRAPRLTVRRGVKLAADGEIMQLRFPLHFDAVEGRLALLLPGPISAADS
jgi:diacylglycerol kinase family enzyme